MISDFRSQGVHTVLITDLHIKKDPNPAYAPYATGMQRDVFVKNPDGSVFVGAVWPGDSVFPDFTLTKARDWWGELYKDFVGMGAGGLLERHERAIRVSARGQDYAAGRAASPG